MTAPVPVTGLTNANGRYVEPIPVGKSYVEPEALEGNVLLKGPSIKLEGEAPVIDAGVVFVSDSIFVPVVVRIPLVRFSNPETLTAFVSVTPALLSIVRFNAPFKPFPVTCAAVPL